jgi:hypothetical protein
VRKRRGNESTPRKLSVTNKGNQNTHDQREEKIVRLAAVGKAGNCGRVPSAEGRGAQGRGAQRLRSASALAFLPRQAMPALPPLHRRPVAVQGAAFTKNLRTARPNARVQAPAASVAAIAVRTAPATPPAAAPSRTAPAPATAPPRFAMSAAEAAAAIAASIANNAESRFLSGEDLEAIIRDGAIHYEPRRRR